MTLRGEALVRRRTKIVATFGPATANDFMVSSLLRAGVDAFRLNLAHGDHDHHRAAAELIRNAARDLALPVALLADLAGPKLRVGQFEPSPIDLVTGHEVTVTNRATVGSDKLIPAPDAQLAANVKPGGRILLADGLIELRADAVEGDDIRCTVVHGGSLSNGKGIHAPGAMTSVPALTDRDRDDVGFLLDIGVDIIAMSFVRNAQDIVELRGLLPAENAPMVIAKIERAEALDAIDEILNVADGIMVARGDLGVDLPPEKVPVAQRELVGSARAHNKPVIIATQMLESMVEHAQPTRAEVSDVSNAVFASADAVMLSAETAVGAFPVSAVEVMDRVCREVESYQWGEDRFLAEATGNVVHFDPGKLPLTTALARSAAQLSRDTRVRGIVVFSGDGATAQVMAAARPAAPLIVVTTDAALSRRVNLLWSVVPFVVDDAAFREPALTARWLAEELDLADEGQSVLTVAGFGHGAPAISVVTV